jgi:hypothetical protein
MSILPQLERDLREAAERTLGAAGARSRRHRRRAVSYGWAPPLAAVLVSIAVAVVALTSLRSGGERSDTAGRVTGQTGLSAPLIANFAVLRRPQTPADIQPRLMPIILSAGLAPSARHEHYRCAGQRIVATPPLRQIHLPAAFLRQQEYPQIECQLMRVVRIPQWHARVVIAPMTFRPNPRSTARSQGLNLVLDDAVGGITGTTGPGVGASGLGLVLRGGLNIFENGPHGTGHGIILIPDGVAKVVLDDIRLVRDGSPAAIAAQSREVLAGVRLAADVRSNIAAFAFPAPTVTTTSSPFGRPPRRSRHHRLPSARQIELVGVNVSGRETWLNGLGNVVRRARVELGLLLRIRII